MFFGFKNISVNIRGKSILENVNLSFDEGKISSILGPNGSGKSTLLKQLAKNHAPKFGEVIYRGSSIYLSDRISIAKAISYLPQIRKSPNDMDVRTLVMCGRHPYKKKFQNFSLKDREISEKVMEFCGLSNLKERRVLSLSGGERQRAWIAMAISRMPEILVLDEPTTYLDLRFQIEVMELVKRLNSEMGMTVILVLHDLNLAAKYSDKLYILKDRGIVMEGTPNQVLTEDNIEKVFGVKSKVIYEDGIPVVIPKEIY